MKLLLTFLNVIFVSIFVVLLGEVFASVFHIRQVLMHIQSTEFRNFNDTTSYIGAVVRNTLITGKQII